MLLLAHKVLEEKSLLEVSRAAILPGFEVERLKKFLIEVGATQPVNYFQLFDHLMSSDK